MTASKHNFKNLKSYIDHIDNYLILDNGLSPSNISDIKKQLHSVQGKIIRDETKITSFSEHRNKLMNYAIEHFDPDFVIETDDSWELDGFDRSCIGQGPWASVQDVDCYSCPLIVPEIGKSSMVVKIYNPRKFKYVGRVHEVLDINPATNIVSLEKTKFIDRCLDIERTLLRPEKEMLLEDIECGISEMSSYYQLGQIYEREGNVKQAIECYDKIINTGASQEMKFLAYVRKGYITKDVNYFIYAGNECYERSAEALYYIYLLNGNENFLEFARRRYKLVSPTLTKYDVNDKVIEILSQ
jgi:hypothetical protein